VLPISRGAEFVIDIWVSRGAVLLFHDDAVRSASGKRGKKITVLVIRTVSSTAGEKY
jgi:hypothetical protein